VQITLSDFRLSGFVILVFSKAKGITLVFRNDPLESLKVSSTFDSIPFIAEYLQKEIERQVRRIFQEDLPVAVHRLSLRLWNPEYAASLEEEATAPSMPLRREGSDEGAENPEVNPLLTPADSSDAPSTMFSQKNLLKLASLVDSQRTLSLDTPRINDAVFRAWASSHNNTESYSDDTAETQSIHSVRPPPPSSRHTPSRRKKKHRVVDLRKKKKEKPDETPASSSTSTSDPSESAIDDGFCERPPARVIRRREDSIDYDSDSRPNLSQTVPVTLQCPPSPAESIATADITFPAAAAPPPPPPAPEPKARPSEKETLRARENAPRFRMPPGTQGTILEQAILSKIMAEIQRSLGEERRKRGKQGKWGFERELENLCPPRGEELPAYAD
jgi:distribution and morphology protein 34